MIPMPPTGGRQAFAMDVARGLTQKPVRTGAAGPSACLNISISGTV